MAIPMFLRADPKSMLHASVVLVVLKHAEWEITVEWVIWGHDIPKPRWYVCEITCKKLAA
jgi:hypothetical protein